MFQALYMKDVFFFNHKLLQHPKPAILLSPEMRGFKLQVVKKSQQTSVTPAISCFQKLNWTIGYFSAACA